MFYSLKFKYTYFLRHFGKNSRFYDEKKFKIESERINMEKEEQHQTENIDYSKLIENGKLKVDVYQQDEVILRNNFIYNQLNYLSRSIQIADAKAGALTAANGLIIKFVADYKGSNQITEILFMGSIFILIIGIFFSLMVVLPKSLRRKAKGIIYWEHIVNSGKLEYVRTIKEASIDLLLEDAIKSNYSQAYILSKKYKKLNIAFFISLFGYFVIFIGLMISLIYKWW